MIGISGSVGALAECWVSLDVEHAHQSLNIIEEASCGLKGLHVDSINLRRLVFFESPNGVHSLMFIVCFVTATIII